MEIDDLINSETDSQRQSRLTEIRSGLRRIELAASSMGEQEFLESQEWLVERFEEINATVTEVETLCYAHDIPAQDATVERIVEELGLD